VLDWVNLRKGYWKIREEAERERTNTRNDRRRRDDIPIDAYSYEILNLYLRRDIPIKQALYATSVAQVGSVVSVQTQVPPL
jgi:hypothetical protein